MFFSLIAAIVFSSCAGKSDNIWDSMTPQEKANAGLKGYDVADGLTVNITEKLQSAPNANHFVQDFDLEWLKVVYSPSIDEGYKTIDWSNTVRVNQPFSGTVLTAKTTAAGGSTIVYGFRDEDNTGFSMIIFSDIIQAFGDSAEIQEMILNNVLKNYDGDWETLSEAEKTLGIMMLLYSAQQEEGVANRYKFTTMEKNGEKYRVVAYLEKQKKVQK